MVSEVRKGVYNECCGGRLGCLFRSPCSGNSSVLIYLERGEALGLLCYSSRGVGGQPARGFPSESAVFRPMCVAEKRCLAVASAGHHPNSRWCGPDLTVVACRDARSIYLRRCGVDRDLSIETAPGGCDDARIKLHYGSMKGGGVINVRVTHPRSGGSACLSKVPVPVTGTSAGESPSCHIASCGLTA